MALSGVYRLLNTSFYYGTFEYPKDSGKWYQGKHKPIVTQELFEKAQENIKTIEANKRSKNKEFAFTKLMKCGLCGSGITAQEKFKHLKDGSVNRYVYYSCTKGKDRDCKQAYVREDELIQRLLKLVDRVSINELGI